MVLLKIDLQDGFTDDLVIITVDGVEVYRREHVKTKLTLGYADSFTLDIPPGDAIVEVRLPSREIAQRIPIRLEESLSLGIFLDDGLVSHRLSRERFRYM